MGDWLFERDGCLCSFRVGGIMRIGSKILLQREINGSEYALPGGHVRFGETAAESLKREFMEEIGFGIRVKRLVWVEELFWAHERRFHQINHYYLVESNGQSAPKAAPEPHLVFKWIDIDELVGLKVFPEFLPEKSRAG